MNRPLSDQSQRARAEAVDASFIVQAPAGSGKTELLTRRYLRLLSCVDLPQRILAITFTRKATQEMLQRILERLAQAGAGPEPQSEWARETHHLARRVLERDRELGWQLMHNPAQLQIHTIDGLCARLAVRGHSGGRASTHLQVTEFPQPLYAEAARLAMERALEGPLDQPAAEALLHFLNRLNGAAQRVAELMADALSRRDQWLSRLASRGEEAPELLALRQDVELRALHAALGEEALGRLLEALKGLVPTSATGEPGKALAEALDTLARVDAGVGARVRAWHVVLATLAVKAGGPKAERTVKRELFPEGGAGRETAVAEVAALCASWREDENARCMFTRFVNTPALDQARENDALVEWMRPLLLSACAELRVLFAERNVCDFQHVTELALEALGDDLAPGEALLLEDGRIGHVLVDEFQDTSRIQLDLLERLTSGWTPGDGRSLFLVGDPMQSIYRFRKADVAIFNTAFETGRLGEVALTPLRLETNFRSCSEVVDFVNRVCPGLFAPPSPAATGAVAYVPVTAWQGGGGRVGIHANHVGIGADGEAEQIAGLVSAALDREPGLTVGVLGRTRAQLEPVAAALRRHAVPFEALDVQRLDQRPVVQDLLSLTRALLHPADRIAWIALLHAPWCGLDAEALLTVAGARHEVDILERLHDEEVLARLPTERRARVQRLREVLEDATAAAGRLPLDRRVEAAWLRLHGPATAATVFELEDAQAFIGLLAHVERDAPPDLLAALQDRLGKLFAASGGASVQLMTIHKAKGLEFDLVVLPGLDQFRRPSPQVLFRLHELGAGPGPGGALLAPVPPSGSSEPALFNYLGTLENEADFSEEQRLLYVALTRARRELHLFGLWKAMGRDKAPGAPARSFMARLWDCFAPVVDEAGAAAGPAPVDDGKPPLYPMLYLDGEPGPGIDPRPDDLVSAPFEMAAPDRDAAALGEAVHRWLELIHDHWDEHWTGDWYAQYQPALESSLRVAGARQESIPELSRQLAALLRRALDDEAASAIIRPGAEQSHAEITFLRAHGASLQRKIIDRLYRAGDETWQIVDYKTGADAGDARDAWVEQLSDYARVLADAGESGSVRRAVLQLGPHGAKWVEAD